MKKLFFLVLVIVLLAAVIYIAKTSLGESKTTFADASIGPNFILIPTGKFAMGDLTNGVKGKWKEAPVHSVTVNNFYISKYELSFSEWDQCHEDGDCSYADDEGWGREDRPVVNVNWSDTQKYIRWLNNKTSKDYRLPTEAEWEYAARAGTKTLFYMGDCITTDEANYNGYGTCERGENRKKTVPIDSFNANQFGLFNMHGNVWEWVEDCWHGSYKSAPSSGKAWLKSGGGNCDKRGLRGGSWHSQAANIRSATRIKDPITYRDYHTGFRLAHSAD